MAYFPSLRSRRHSLWAACFALLVAFVPAIFAQTPVSADGFNPDVGGVVNVLALQPNGQVLVGGTFTTLQPNGATTPTTRNNIARLNVDGSLDTTFDPEANGPVLAIVVQANGQVVIGGNFTTLQPGGGATVTRNHIARFNANGTLDTTFNPDATGPISGEVTSLALQANGQILVGGSFTAMQPNGAASPTAISRMARLNTDGSLDTTFTPSPNAQVDAMYVEANGQIIIGGAFTILQPGAASTQVGMNYIARVNANGTVDTSFNPDANGTINSIVIQANGQILIAGSFTTLQPNGSANAASADYIARLNSDGSMDTNFTAEAGAQISQIALQTDGKIVVAGNIGNFSNNGTSNGQTTYLARLNFDGTTDITFNPDPNYVVNAVAIQTDGKIVIGGNFSQLWANSALDLLEGVTQPPGASIVRNALARINIDGTLDTDFNPNASGSVGAIAVQPNGQVIIGGTFSSIGGATVTNIARLNANGTVDTSFYNSAPNGPVSSIVIQSNGQIIVAGAFTTIGASGAYAYPYIARLNTNGTVDTTYDPDPTGPIYSMALQPNGELIVGGVFGSFTTNGTGPVTPATECARLNSDGTVDVSFTPNPYGGPVYSVILEPSDNAVIIAGGFSSVTPASTAITSPVQYMARLNATDGSLDTTFTPNPNGPIFSMALQPNGQILLGGNFTTLQPNPVTTTTVVNGVVITATTPLALTRSYIARINADATLDQNFDPEANGPVLSVAVNSTTGQVAVGGRFTYIAGGTRDYVARLDSAGQLDSTLNVALNGPVNTVQFTSSGEIFAGGGFTTAQAAGSSTAIPVGHVALFTAAGNLDTTFNVSGTIGGAQITTLAVQPDSKILAGGTFTNIDGTYATNLTRFNADGTQDGTFPGDANGTVNSVVAAPDGTNFAGGSFSAIALGTANNFAHILPGGTITGISVTAGGSGYTGPTVTISDPTGVGATASITQSGGVITGITLLTPGSGYSNPIILIADPAGSGATAVAGWTILRVDPAYTVFPDGPVTAIVIQPNGQAIIAGTFQHVGATAAPGVARYNTNGTLDTTFSFAGVSSGSIASMALQANGQILIAGNFLAVGGTSVNCMARLNTNGTLDTSFTANLPTRNANYPAIALQANGQILVGGKWGALPSATLPELVRLNSNGSTDASFSDFNLSGVGNGGINSVVVQADGNIVVGGTFSTYSGVGFVVYSNLVRLLPSGAFDPTFAPAPNGAVLALALQRDGKTVVAGSFSTIGGQARAGLARLAATAAVSQAITISTDLSTLTWTRSGPGPELSSVTFESSIDDLTWTPIGQATRIGTTANWQLTGVGGLPSGTNFFIRAAGLAPTNEGASVGVVQQDQEIYAQALSTLVSSSTATGTSGASFYYSIAATNLPTSYAATGLPSGLTLNATSGAISGTPTQSGTFPVTLSLTTAGGTTVIPIVITIAASSGTTPPAVAPLSRLINLSSRASVSTGNPLIAGFVISGSAPKSVLLRGDGPSLSTMGVTTPLAKPVLQLYDASGQLVLTNSGWDGSSALMKIFATLGAFPLTVGSTDSAVVTTLAPGNYTMQVSTGDGTTGTALAEVYDADANPLSLAQRLINLSGRGVVSTGNPVIGGFVISGTVPKNVLIRGIGPGLATTFGLTGTLAAPTLTLFAGGTVIAQNTGWGTPVTVNATYPAASSATIATDAANAGAFSLQSGSADSALVVTLPPGNYTAQITGPSGQTGTALFEIYELQ